jgi:hypothetical protein
VPDILYVVIITKVIWVEAVGVKDRKNRVAEVEGHYNFAEERHKSVVESCK